jgi:hypothetical protein
MFEDGRQVGALATSCVGMLEGKHRVRVAPDVAKACEMLIRSARGWKESMRTASEDSIQRIQRLRKHFQNISTEV